LIDKELPEFLDKYRRNAGMFQERINISWILNQLWIAEMNTEAELNDLADKLEWV
jgi:hypothetical protein